ncbi:MAG: OmpA family protein [Thiomonas sp.]
MKRLAFIGSAVVLVALGLGGCASTAKKPDSASTAHTSAQPEAPQAQSQVVAVQAPEANTAEPGPNIAKQVFFDFDKYTLKKDDLPVIKANAQFLDQHPNAHVQIQGNCDPRGSHEYNLALGQERAKAVMKAMELLGAQAGQMDAVSFGSEKADPAPSAWAHDRRVDIVYQR